MNEPKQKYTPGTPSACDLLERLNAAAPSARALAGLRARAEDAVRLATERCKQIAAADSKAISEESLRAAHDRLNDIPAFDPAGRRDALLPLAEHVERIAQESAALFDEASWMRYIQTKGALPGGEGLARLRDLQVAEHYHAQFRNNVPYAVAEIPDLLPAVFVSHRAAVSAALAGCRAVLAADIPDSMKKPIAPIAARLGALADQLDSAAASATWAELIGAARFQESAPVADEQPAPAMRSRVRGSR